MLDDMGIEIPSNEKKAEGNPFLQFGYGVNAFFDLMLALVYMFGFLSLVCLPVLLVYSQNAE